MLIKSKQDCMDYGKTTSDRLQELISALQKSYSVFAPVKGEETVFESVDNPESVTLDFENFTLSPKSAFFPKTEKLFTITEDGPQDIHTAPEPFVLFGVRPCDASSFTLLDLVFAKENGGVADPYYFSKREKGTVVSYACSSPCSSCFCTSFENSGPAGEQGADVIMYNLGDDLIFKGITEKGKSLLDSCSGILSDIDESDLAACEKQAEESEKAVSAIDTSETAEKVKGNFYDSLWKDIADKCLGCGICTYLCPTCHCFDITDEKTKTGIDRLRVWDSCQFSLFTHHASGHNPRPSQTERMRQRVLHKFSYTVKNFERIFCVGCGRCVSRCTVNLDIRETVTSLNTLTPKQGEDE